MCNKPAEAMVDSDTKDILKGNTAFAFDLYAELKDEDGNIFFSPYSISSALAMTYAGAKANTKKQMAEVLHFGLEQKLIHAAFSEIQQKLNKNGKKGTYELNIANALWGQQGYPFMKEFIDMLNENYGAGLNEVDFINATEVVRKNINKWVENQTNDKIKDLIQPGVLSSYTRLVLTNAIYFKGMWASQFKKDQTKDAPFTLLNGKKAEVPMMHQKEQFKYSETNDLKVLELSYRGDEISMLILLPKKFDGLKDLENSLTADKLNQWLPKRKTEVLVYLPKFKMTSQFMLADVLNSMGMTDAFSLPPADFSGMTGKKDLFISAVIHKAFVDVNEEGTEAAAATAVVMATESVAPEPPVFRADHPFIFMIRDNFSGSILFVGRVVNPKER